jgi:hypothetical protein
VASFHTWPRTFVNRHNLRNLWKEPQQPLAHRAMSKWLAGTDRPSHSRALARSPHRASRPTEGLQSLPRRSHALSPALWHGLPTEPAARPQVSPTNHCRDGSTPLHLLTSSPPHLFTPSPLHPFTSSPLHPLPLHALVSKLATSNWQLPYGHGNGSTCPDGRNPLLQGLGQRRHPVKGTVIVDRSGEREQAVATLPSGRLRLQVIDAPPRRGIMVAVV